MSSSGLSAYYTSPTAASNYIELIFKHFENQLLLVGHNEVLEKLPPKIKTALVNAHFTAIDVFKGEMGDVDWERDWYINAKAGTLKKVFADDIQSSVYAELEYTASSLGINSSPFMVCGGLAVRNLNEYLSEGKTGAQWVENYEGTFATLVGLYKSIGTF